MPSTGVAALAVLALSAAGSEAVLRRLSRAAAASSSAGAALTPAPGCVRVEEFVVSNQCSGAIVLKGWEQRIAPGETASITASRSTDLQRVSWRLEDGPNAYDYIELNADWAVAGTDLCAHPNYATWYGFSTSSRYEALDAAAGGLACEDAGSEVRFSPATCPEGYGPSDQLLCDFHATQASIRNCSSVPALYQATHTWAINGDGSTTPRFSCPEGGTGKEWCGVWTNYPCAPESPDWPNYRVGSWIDCTGRQKSIIFKLTTCI